MFTIDYVIGCEYDAEERNSSIGQSSKLAREKL